LRSLAGRSSLPWPTSRHSRGLRGISPLGAAGGDLILVSTLRSPNFLTGRPPTSPRSGEKITTVELGTGGPVVGVQGIGCMSMSELYGDTDEDAAAFAVEALRREVADANLKVCGPERLSGEENA
jgi:hypothetical protein